jgi:hypothetical protein
MPGKETKSFGIYAAEKKKKTLDEHYCNRI